MCQILSISLCMSDVCDISVTIMKMHTVISLDCDTMWSGGWVGECLCWINILFFFSG
jgi:hypothetical protein